MTCTAHQIPTWPMKWARYVAHVGRGVIHTGFWQGNLDERNHLEDLDIGGEIIFKRILKK